jgi:hypothetical protein
MLDSVSSLTMFPGLDDRLRVCAELLVTGVAFQQDGKTWSVFSHEGEEIGIMSTYWVNATTHAMKKLGWKVNGFDPIMYGDKPAITFGHHPDNMPRLLSNAEYDIILKRRHRKVVTIH